MNYQLENELDIFRKNYHSKNVIVYDSYLVYRNFKNDRESLEINIFGCNKLIKDLGLNLIATGTEVSDRMFFDSYVIKEKPQD